MELTKASIIVLTVTVLSGCGEPMFENAGSQHSLLEDREACATEINQTPGALAYREDPAAHPDYVNGVLDEMNRCIERKGWKQVRSQEEQEQVNQAIKSEWTQSSQPASLSDSKATEAFVRGVEEKLARTLSAVPSAARKD
ncbi:MAG TPA: hypothetical protein VKP13_05055 [Nitrospira sp.]|nr:hypothetical protein [Nitrospira sp.]